MKFSEIKYERPDLDSLKIRIGNLLNQFKSASDSEEQYQIFEAIYRERAHFETMSNVASVRHTIDTSVKYYEEEQKFFDLNYPAYQDLVTQFYKALIASQ